MKKMRMNYVNCTLDFAPVIATVLIATLASLKATRSDVTSLEIVQWNLVVLLLLATTQLVDRFRVLRGINAKVEQLMSIAQGPTTADTFLHWEIPDSDLADRLRRAKTIGVNGLTLISTITRKYEVFQNCLSQRVRV